MEKQKEPPYLILQYSQGGTSPQHLQSNLSQNHSYDFLTTILNEEGVTPIPLLNPPPDYLIWSKFNLILNIIIPSVFYVLGIFTSIIALEHSKKSRFYSSVGDELVARLYSKRARTANAGATGLIVIGLGSVIGVFVYFNMVIDTEEE